MSILDLPVIKKFFTKAQRSIVKALLAESELHIYQKEYTDNSCDSPFFWEVVSPEDLSEWSNQLYYMMVGSEKERWGYLPSFVGKWINTSSGKFLVEQNPDNRYMQYRLMSYEVWLESIPVMSTIKVFSEEVEYFGLCIEQSL